MYLTPYQKKQLTIVIILVIGIPLTLFAGFKAVQWFTSANADTRPHNIVLSNITTNSAVISWTTESKQRGSVVTILDGSQQSTVTDKRGNSRRNTHYVQIKNLEPGTEYDFKIISGDDTYKGAQNSDFTFTTANIGTETPVPKPIHGELGGNSGEDAVIYVLTKDKSTYPVAVYPSDNGNWLLDLSLLRKISDRSLYTVTDSTELVIIAISGVDDGGVVEGEYGDIFDSGGELTEDLVPTGGEYDSYISDDAKLTAADEPDNGDDDDDDDDDDNDDDDDDNNGGDNDDNDNDDDNDDNPPTGGGWDDDDDDPFNREYELRSDLVWIDMVDIDSTGEVTPENYGPDTVMTTNLTDVGFTVLWYSEDKETGYIEYGNNTDSLSETGRDERDGLSSQGEYYLHSIEVTDLQPETRYYFEVYSGEEPYNETFEVQTFSTQNSPPEFETIAGSAEVGDYESFVVIATFTDDDGAGSTGTSYPISTLVDSEGSWILTIGSTRDESGGYFEKSSTDLVTFNPMYLSEPSEVQMTLGEATTDDVTLTAPEGRSGTTFVKIPKLSDYGILTD
jgi:hypothetical protein